MIIRTIILIVICVTTSINAQGLKFNKEAFLAGPSIERTRDDRIPKIASLKGYTPYVLTQNKSNCVAYSVATARTMLLARDLNLTGKDTITTFYFSPHWVYYRNKEDSDTDCMDGLDLEIVSLDVLMNGIAPMLSVEYESYYPWGSLELCNYYPDTYSMDLLTALDFKVDDVFRLKNLEDIKLALSQGMPCVVGMLVPPSFKTAIGKESWSSVETDTYDDAYGHAMVVVGYDDYKHGGAVEIMNSWGTDWGNEGYIWIKYEEFLKYTLGAYAYQTIPDNSFDTAIDSILLKDKLMSGSVDTSLVEKFNKLHNLVKDLH